MDQITHNVRRQNWLNIITACQNRTTDTTVRQWLSDNGGSVPIIALSANAFKEDIEQSYAAGMNAHVSKPIDIRELFETLAKF